MKVISPKRLLQSVFPTVRNGSIFNASSLDLQFARTKTLDSRITFTRASSGTYVDSQGVIRTATTNEARFDHNPTTGESLGLLVEEQRTNLLLRSEEFDSASWTKTACSVTANVHSSPSGLVTADKIVEDNTNAQRYVSQFITVAAATQTISFYAKGDGRTIAIFYADNGNVGQGFVLTGNGSLQGNFGASAPTSATIQAVGNGWYRCSATWATTAGSTAIRIYPAANTSSPVYQGDGTSGIYLWGAQLEAGSFPTSYIPTTTAAVTRSADVASITGSNFSSWYRQDEGTVFVSVRLASLVNTYEASFTDNSNNNHHFLRYVSGQHQVVTKVGGADGVNIFSDGGGGIAVARSAYRYGTSSFVISTNGLGGAFSTAANSVPTVDRLNIGMSQLAGATGNLHVTRLTYWPQRLPNETLQQITQ